MRKTVLVAPIVSGFVVPAWGQTLTETGVLPAEDSAVVELAMGAMAGGLPPSSRAPRSVRNSCDSGT
jgi:hypothetical protein